MIDRMFIQEEKVALSQDRIMAKERPGTLPLTVAIAFSVGLPCMLHMYANDIIIFNCRGVCGKRAHDGECGFITKVIF